MSYVVQLRAVSSLTVGIVHYQLQIYSFQYFLLLIFYEYLTISGSFCSSLKILTYFYPFNDRCLRFICQYNIYLQRLVLILHFEWISPQFFGRRWIQAWWLYYIFVIFLAIDFYRYFTLLIYPSHWKPLLTNNVQLKYEVKNVYVRSIPNT